jgi:hypothetical protein
MKSYQPANMRHLSKTVPIILTISRLFFLKVPVIFFGLLFTMTASSVEAQTVQFGTDDVNYHPGGNVGISGSGFQPEEVVTIQVIHASSEADNSTNEIHQPWDLTADSDGNISALWTVSTKFVERGEFKVIANGLSSGTHESIFTIATSVTTNMNDYTPGSTAEISGYGFQPGETVTLQVVHAEGSEPTTDPQYHQPFTAVADNRGQVSSSWLIPTEGSMHAIFKLTASGSISGLYAEAKFNDALEIQVTSLPFTNTQNFDGLLNTSDGSTSSTTPTGWYLHEQGGDNTYRVGSGTSTNGTTYSFGLAPGNTERAFGSLTSGTVTPIYIGAKLTNSTATPSTITTVVITYTGEQWRVGANQNNPRDERLDFEYSTNAASINDAAATWNNSINSLDFPSKISSVSSSGALNGNLAANRTTGITGTISNLTLTNGQSLWIRWKDVDVVQNDDGLAIDDVNLTVTGADCQLPTVTTTTTNVKCFGGGDGAINLTVSGGTAPYQFAWTTISGSGISDISAEDQLTLTAGSYGVTVSNSGGGCPITISPIVITQPSSALALSQTHTNASCYGGNNGSINLTVSGGAAPPLFVLPTQDFNTLSVSGEDVPFSLAGWAILESGTAPEVDGNYDGNTGSNTTGNTYSYGLSGSQERALGELTTNTFSTQIGFSYQNATGRTITGFDLTYTGEQWRIGTSGTQDKLDFQYSTNATSLSTGTWIDANLLDFIAPVPTGTTGTINGNNSPNRTLINSTVPGLSIPVGNNIWIRWVSTNPANSDHALAIDDVSLKFSLFAYDFLWSPGGSTSEDPTGLVAGNYTVVVTDAGGCTKSLLAPVEITQPSEISFTATPTQPKCFGGTGSVALSTATGGTGAINFGATPTTALTVGDYTYTATDANGCTTQHTVHINAAPAAISFTATPTQPKCFGETGSVVLSTPTGGTGAINFDGTATSGLAEGDYTYTATDANGCIKKQTVHINAAPAVISFTATPTQPKCFGETGSVILSTPTGGTGAVSFDATPTSGLGENDYTYTATDANGCTIQHTVHINAAPAAISFTATPTQPKCFGETGSVALSSPAGGTGAIGFGSTPTTGLAEGEYTYTATDVNGCTAQQTVHIDAGPSAISFTATPTHPKCIGETGSVALSTPTGGTGAISFGSTSTTGLAGGDYTYTATDANGCTAQQTVHINAAPSAVIASSSYTPIACNGGTSTVTVSASGGTAFSSAPLYNGIGTFTVSSGPYSYTVTDANGCTGVTTGTISQPGALAVSCTNNNNDLYFGYTGDQTSTFTATPSGGTGPYEVKITMNRALLCNQINDAGDEIWTTVGIPNGGGTTTGNTCMAYPNTASSTPVSVKTISSGSYAVNVTLMADADITATIKDTNGCTTTCTKHIHGDDVRCFAGNSGRAKVTLCHKTGSAKNPCVTICVDDDAVAEHMFHGDFMGKCNNSCTAPAPTARPVDLVMATELTLKVMPNPTPNYFNVKIIGKTSAPVTVRVMDIYGRLIQLNEKIASNVTLRLGDKWTSGGYFIEATQGNERKMVKVVKVN